MAKIRFKDCELLPGGVEHVAPGFALPKAFKAYADVADDVFGEMPVEVEVELQGSRVRARRVCVETGRDIGIGSGTLRAIPVREIVFRGVIRMLLRIELTDEGPAYTQGKTGQLDDEEYDVVKQLVGYVDPDAVALEEGER